MADILKISTPLLDRVPTQATRPVADPSVPFDLSDVTRVIQTTDPTELLQQNTGFVPNQADTPKILEDLLKDPAVTAGMIRNIAYLQEIISLMPALNAALTQEIEQLFANLLLTPQEIVPELIRQENTTTLFKGDLFDQLRGLLSKNPERQEMATAIGVLLKGLNAGISRTDVLYSISNNLSFLAQSLEASPRLFDKLETLMVAFRAPDANHNFTELKQQVMEVLKEVQNSVLYTPQLEKIIPLVVYNLSRYNDNDDFLPTALTLLLSTMDGDAQKLELIEKLQNYIDVYMPPEGARRARYDEDDSQVMDILAKIIGKQAKSEEVQLLSGDKIEKIIHSLLSSPSNFTPLLHFILPVEYHHIRAFAEIWIDPNAGGSDKQGNGNDGTRMMLVFDVDGVGRFESELYVRGKRIAMNLFCPPAYYDAFSGLGPAIRKAISATSYSFEVINIDRLERNHSLMDVFTDLPHKRTGIDVKV